MHLEQRVHAEQVKVVFGQTMTAAIGNPLAGLLLMWMLWDLVGHGTLLVWCSALAVTSAARAGANVFFRRRDDDTAMLGWGRLYTLMAFLQGSVWAFAWLRFIPAGDPIQLVIATTWMMGLSASAVSAYSVNLVAMLAFFFPVVLPGTIHLFVIGGKLGVSLGMALSLYTIIVIRAVVPVNRSMIDSIRLNFELEAEIDERKKAEQRLIEISKLDGLTGLANRNHFDTVLEEEFRRAKRAEYPISLILMDLDYFKAYNDTYGHPAGDTCLQRVSATIGRAAKRPGDVAARYGGEELALVLPGANADNAAAVAESIRADIEGLGIPHGASDVAEVAVVTTSSGVATIVPDRSAEPAMLVQLADEALYRAKREGRNRVVRSCDGGIARKL